MSETVTPLLPDVDDPRVRGIQIEAALREWNIPFAYNAEMSVKDIRVVSGAQVRSTEHQVNKDQVEKYTAQMGNGAVFPPLLVAGENILLDGNTRLAAAKRIRWTTIPVFQAHFPNMELGIAFAAAMNQRNGRALAPEEAHKAAISLLRFGHTEESVARELGYSRTAIANWRKEAEFAKRADETMTTDQAGNVDKNSQRKLADVKLSAPFAAAVDLVADLKPKAAQVTELVKAIKEAPSEADAVQIVTEKKAEWQPSGPPPHRVPATKELQAARRALPLLLANADNPALLVEMDESKREESIQRWVKTRELAEAVLGLYRG